MKEYKIPSSMRKLLVAQFGKCYLCGESIDPFTHYNDDRGPSKDHVRPKSKGFVGDFNQCLAHKRCNMIKGDRDPRPCELLFLAVTNAIAESVWHSKKRSVYVPPSDLWPGKPGTNRGKRNAVGHLTRHTSRVKI